MLPVEYYASLNLNSGDDLPEVSKTNLKYQLERITDDFATSKSESTSSSIQGKNDTMLISVLKLYYNLDSFAINEEEKANLRRLLSKYDKYEKLQLEIRSHTDCRGSHQYNFHLSSKRSSSVKKVIESELENIKIKISNFGELRLVNNCKDGIVCKEQQHAINRRSEIVFFTTEKLNYSENLTAYHILSDTEELNDSIHEIEMGMLRRLNIFHITEQLGKVFNFDYDDKLLMKKAEIIKYFKDKTSSSIVLSQGYGSALYDMSCMSIVEGEYVIGADSDDLVLSESNDQNQDCLNIPVYFFDNIDDKIKNEIISTANLWFWEYPEKGFYLEEDKSKINTAVRIEVRSEKETIYKSYVGCNKPSEKSSKLTTMWLSDIDRIYKKNLEIFRFLVLHEFGHVLNRHHEFLHDQVLTKIDANKYFIFYRDNIDKTATQMQINTLLSSKGHSYDQFDNTSVMNYDIPRQCIKDEELEVIASTNLSDADKKYVKDYIINKSNFLSNKLIKP